MMKDEITKFKNQNGNVTYTVKELIGALHTKMDIVNDKLNRGSGNIKANREAIRNLKWVAGGLGAAYLGLVICAVTGVI